MRKISPMLFCRKQTLKRKHGLQVGSNSNSDICKTQTFTDLSLRLCYFGHLILNKRDFNLRHQLTHRLTHPWNRLTSLTCRAKTVCWLLCRRLLIAPWACALTSITGFLIYMLGHYPLCSFAIFRDKATRHMEVFAAFYCAWKQKIPCSVSGYLKCGIMLTYRRAWYSLFCQLQCLSLSSFSTCFKLIDNLKCSITIQKTFIMGHCLMLPKPLSRDIRDDIRLWSSPFI